MWTQFWEWLAHLPQGSASFVGTLTGSSLGLVALLLGALFNAQLNRRRDDRLRNIERKSVAVALHAELSSIQKTLLGNAESLTNNPPEDGGGFVVPDVIHSTIVLEHMLPRIGLLDPATTRKVLDAHILLGQYFQSLMLVGGTALQNLPEGRRLLSLPSSMASFTIEFNQGRAAVVKEAIDALARYVK